MKIHLHSQTVLETYPSGSGLESDGKFLYLIGDDTNQLAQLDETFALVSQTELYSADKDDWREKNPNRLKRSRKRDFEATTWLERDGQPGILLMGSGSGTGDEDEADRLKNRSKACWVPVTEGKVGEPVSLKVKDLYERLRQDPLFLDASGKTLGINLEAAATLPETLLLVSRGGNGKPNVLILVNDLWEENPVFRTCPIATPPIAGCESGISGTCYLPAADAILVSLSAEIKQDDAPNEVRGSALALIRDVRNRITSGHWEMEDFTLLETPVPIKVESVVVSDVSPDGSLDAVAVADNDDGKTTLIPLHLTPARPLVFA